MSDPTCTCSMPNGQHTPMCAGAWRDKDERVTWAENEERIKWGLVPQALYKDTNGDLVLLEVHYEVVCQNKACYLYDAEVGHSWWNHSAASDLDFDIMSHLNRCDGPISVKVLKEGAHNG